MWGRLPVCGDARWGVYLCGVYQRGNPVRPTSRVCGWRLFASTIKGRRVSHFNITITGLTPLEAAQHLVQLVTSGQLGSELQSDPQCVIDCVYVIERMFLTRVPGPFGAVSGTPANEEAQVIHELDQLKSFDPNAPAVHGAAPAGIPPWILQIAIQAFLAWLARQQKS